MDDCTPRRPVDCVPGLCGVMCVGVFGWEHHLPSFLSGSSLDRVLGRYTDKPGLKHLSREDFGNLQRAIEVAGYSVNAEDGAHKVHELAGPYGPWIARNLRTIMRQSNGVLGRVPVNLMGIVGNDALGDRIIKDLRDEGIGCASVLNLMSQTEETLVGRRMFDEGTQMGRFVLPTRPSFETELGTHFADQIMKSDEAMTCLKASAIFYVDGRIFDSPRSAFEKSMAYAMLSMIEGVCHHRASKGLPYAVILDLAGTARPRQSADIIKACVERGLFTSLIAKKEELFALTGSLDDGVVKAYCQAHLDELHLQLGKGGGVRVYDRDGAAETILPKEILKTNIGGTGSGYGLAQILAGAVNMLGIPKDGYAISPEKKAEMGQDLAHDISIIRGPGVTDNAYPKLIAPLIDNAAASVAVVRATYSR